MNLIHLIIVGASFGGLCAGADVLPQNPVNAAVGDAVTFTTSLDPTQIPFRSIQWKFGTKTIITSSAANSTSTEYRGRITLYISTGSLELRNLTLNDKGEYNVTITTADGAVLKGLTTLNIWEGISDVLVESSAQLPEEGTSLNLTCRASGTIVTREWMKNGSPLNPSSNIFFYNDKQVLSFRGVNRKDSGRYTCKISNPVSSQEATDSMVVLYGPENVQISGQNEVLVKTTLRLSCSAESVPAASYIWIKNGTTVANSSEYTKNITEDLDSGEYICQATNEITMKTSEESHRVLITAPKSSLSAGAIAGITIACLVIVVGAVVGGFFIYKKHTGGKKKSRHRSADRTTEPKPSRTSNVYTDEHVYENPSTIYDRNL